MNKLEYYMYNFNVKELAEFLGEDLTDLLVEWLPENEPIFTEENLIKMILSVYGNKILDNSKFRLRLYKAFEKETIMDYRVVLEGYEEEEDLPTLIEAINNVPWGKNKVSLRLLEYLDISKEYFDKLEDDRDAIEMVDSYDRFFELLDYQFLIKQKILTYVNSDNDETKMLVRMPTGTGKTKTAMHTIINQYIFRQKKSGLMIWIAHTKELLDQAYETFSNVWRHLGQGKVKTFKLWDKFEVVPQDIEDGFLFCGIQKLISIENRDSLLFDVLIEKCKVVIIDEAHRAGAAKTKKVINALLEYRGRRKSLIGLTATPGRLNSIENDLFQSMFDNKVIDIDTAILNQLNMSKVDADNANPEKDIIKYFQNRGVLSRLERIKLEYGELSPDEISVLRVHMTSNGYKDLTDEFLKTIAQNKKRNTQIVNKLIDLNSNHIPTIVFACSVEHGRMLSAALSIQGIKNGHVFGDMDPGDRKEVIERFKNGDDDMNILINFEVLTTGFDATNIGCVFITRPTNSVVLYSQMLGRGLRGPLMGGNPTCYLIDIEDNLKKYTNESEAFNYFTDYWT